MEFIVELRPIYDDLIRIWFDSRHSSRKKHKYIYIIQYNERSVDHRIAEWYFMCKVEWRDVGRLIHVTTLLWHLAVCGTEANQNILPFSVSRILAAINDSISRSDDLE